MRVNIEGFGIIGCILSVVMSWIVNHSIVWAILHFFCFMDLRDLLVNCQNSFL